MEYKHKYPRLAYMYITYAVAIICGFVLFSSCSNVSPMIPFTFPDIPLASCL